jgi:hypothetical protein
MIARGVPWLLKLLKQTTERTAQTANGGLMLLATLVVTGLLIWTFITGIIAVEEQHNGWPLVIPGLLLWRC